MAPHRVALVGAGRIARLRAKNAAAHVPRLRLVVVADPAPGASSELATVTGFDGVEDWRELLARDAVEALLVCRRRSARSISSPPPRPRRTSSARSRSPRTSPPPIAPSRPPRVVCVGEV